MKNSIYFFVALSILLTSFTACKDDDEMVDPPIETSFDLNFDIAHTYGAEALVLSSSEQLYEDGVGTNISFTDLKYLLTNIVLHKSDGSDYTPKDAEAFINLAENRTSFTLVDVPRGDYTGISFFVGVDEAANHGDPNQYAVTHPLSPVLNLMHWSWSDGYIFLTLEGLYKDGMDSTNGFVYHVATDNFLMDYEFKNLDFSLDTDKTVKLNFNAQGLFNNPNVIDIPVMGAVSHSGDDGGIAEKIHINMQSVITIDAIE